MTELDTLKSRVVGRQVHGRIFNTINSEYNLPHDAPEYARLDVQHYCNKLALGGLFAPVDLVNEVLKPEEGREIRVLDLGTGSGIWAIEMAREFPHVDVVGLDLAPYLDRPKPSNCRFVQGDFLKGLDQFEGQFDLVHARSVTHAVRGFPAFLHSLASILKPSGVLLVVDGDLTLADENFQDLKAVEEELPNHSYVVDIFADIAAANAASGGITRGTMWREHLEQCKELTGLESKVVYPPLGPWQAGTDEQATRLRAVGALAQKNYLEFLRSARPLLLSFGLDQDHVDSRIAKADEELCEGHKRLYTQWHYFWARKA